MIGWVRISVSSTNQQLLCICCEYIPDTARYRANSEPCRAGITPEIALFGGRGMNRHGVNTIRERMAWQVSRSGRSA